MTFSASTRTPISEAYQPPVTPRGRGSPLSHPRATLRAMNRISHALNRRSRRTTVPGDQIKMPRAILAAVLAATLSSHCFSQHTRQDTRLFPVGADGKAGYIDSTGAIVIKLQFDDARHFSEGLAAVQTGEKWGYIDGTGRFIIAPQFDQADAFSEGLAAVTLADKLGYVDRSGRFVVPPVFTAPGFAFSDGLAAIRSGEKWGYLDRDGRMVIDSQYERARPFNEGLGAVKIGGKWGFVDKTGGMLIRARFDLVGRFSEGLAPAKVGQRVGYVDRTGRQVIDPQFENAWPFSEGLAAVQLGDKWGYIDRSGSSVIKPQFSEVSSFSDGRAAVKSNDRWAYIDRAGALMVIPRVDFTAGFDGGMALVAIDAYALDGQGWIDRAGKYVWAPSILKAPEDPSDDEYSKAMKSDLRDLVTAEEAYFADSVKYLPPLHVPSYSLTAGVSFASGAMTREGWWAVVQQPGTTLKCGIFINGPRGESRAVQEGAPRCWLD